MSENKVKFGLKKCYYAVATEAASGLLSFGTPVAMPGAVSLTLDPEGESTTFYADDVAYYTTASNNGYSGSLELAQIPQSFRVSCLGESLDDNNVLYEQSGADVNAFALLFEFDGDQQATRHVFYNCKAERPSVSGSTKETSVEVETETINITALPGLLTIDDSNVEVVKAKTSGDTTSATYSGWYTSVYTPTVE